MMGKFTMFIILFLLYKNKIVGAKPLSIDFEDFNDEDGVELYNDYIIHSDDTIEMPSVTSGNEPTKSNPTVSFPNL